jgi:hypothetical protein
MYQVEKTAYGVKMTFAGMPELEEAKQFVSEYRTLLESVNSPFCLLVDSREQKPMPPDTEQVMSEAYAMSRAKGELRMAILVPSGIARMQLERRSKTNGTYEQTRYIDSSAHPDCEKIAIDWLVSGTDPTEK